MEKEKSSSNSASKGEEGESSSTCSSKLNLKDAAAYLNEVKKVFEKESEKFDEFLSVLNDFHAKRIDRESTLTKVKELLKWNKDLILGFNAFLGKGSALPTSELEEEAHGFLVRVKNRFEGSKIFEHFLELLGKYRKKKKTLEEVYIEVTVLFGDQTDLLKEFGSYVPMETVKEVPPKKRHMRAGDNTEEESSPTKNREEEKEEKEEAEEASSPMKNREEEKEEEESSPKKNREEEKEEAEEASSPNKNREEEKEGKEEEEEEEASSPNKNREEEKEEEESSPKNNREEEKEEEDSRTRTP